MAPREMIGKVVRDATESPTNDVFLEQAATLCAMFKKDAKRFKNEPVTQELAGLAHCYWSQYPLWLNMMGFPESKQSDPQLIYNATSALDHAHRNAMLVLMKFVAQRGLDSSSISFGATLCREMYHADFWRYFPNGAQCDQWPLSLGAELLKLDADQRQAIQTATATLQELHVVEFVAGSVPLEAVGDDTRENFAEPEQFVGQLGSVARAVLLAMWRNGINNVVQKKIGQAIAKLPKAGLQYNTPMKEALSLLQQVPYQFVECPGRGYFLTQRGCVAAEQLDSEATANKKSGQSRR
ncbi:MAG: hypothetical protein ACKV2Q_31450 [Planctomycetaceae bacterium]